MWIERWTKRRKRDRASGPDPATLGTPEHQQWFLAARREWDDRYGGMAAERRHWRRMALGLFGLLVMSGLFINELYQRGEVVPYIVEVDRSGESTAVGPADAARRPGDEVIRHQLGLFLRNVRSKLADPEAQALLTDDAYAMARGRARDLMRGHLERRRSELRGSQNRIRVEVEAVFSLSEDTWHVEWKETRRGHQILGEKERRLQAVLTVVWDPATHLAELEMNPLGIYVTEIQWSETT